MVLKIDQEILDSTNCPKDFPCLSGKEDDLFKVQETLGYNMLVVDGPHPINCKYSANYGGLHGCKCPVRLAIYRKYGI